MRLLRVFITTIMTGIFLVLYSSTCFANVEDDYEFSLHQNNATITKYLGSNDIVYVPEKLFEYNVTGIGAYAFESDYIKSITLPNTVKEIHDAAFRGCPKLEYISLPEGLTHLSVSFSACYALNSVVLPNSLESIGNFVFNGCHELKSIVLPQNMNSISTYAFPADALLFCSKDSITAHTLRHIRRGFVDPQYPDFILMWNNINDAELLSLLGYIGTDTECAIPDFVKTIEKDAFYNQYYMERIYLPDEIGIISGFRLCYADLFCHVDSKTAKALSASPFNRSFIDPEYPDIKLQYSEDQLILKQYVGNGTICTVPSFVTHLCNDSFFNCDTLRKIYLPDSLEGISWTTFAHCNARKYCSLGSQTAYRISSIGESFYTQDMPDWGLKYGVDHRLWLSRYSGTENEVTIPDAYPLIANGTFGNQPSAQRIIVPNKDAVVENSAFDYVDNRVVKCWMGSSAEKAAASSLLSIEYFDTISGIQTSIEEESISVSWKALEYADSYEIWRSDKDRLEYELLATLDTNNYVDSDVSIGVEYKYRIRAIRKPESRITAYTEFSESEFTSLLNEVTSIRLNAATDDTIYRKGEELYISQWTLNTQYKDGSSTDIPVTVDMISGYDAFCPGNQTVTITYENCTTTVTVTVLDEFEICFIGNDGEIIRQLLTENDTLTLPDNPFVTPSLQRFKAWRIENLEYSPGTILKPNKSLSITAIWEDVFNPDIEDAIISCIPSDTTVIKGEKITFTANMLEPLQAKNGDIRLIPDNWRINPQGDFATGYTQEFDTSGMTTGEHTLFIVYRQEQFRDGKWHTTGNTEQREIHITILETPMLPKTGDESNTALAMLCFTLSCILFSCMLRKRKMN